MTWQWIGNSNLYRHKAAFTSASKDRIATKSTTMLQFRLQVEASSTKWITCSGLESILQEAYSEGIKEEEAPFEKVIEKAVKMLAEKSTSDSMVTLAPIIYPGNISVSGRAGCGAVWDRLKAEHEDSILFISRPGGLKMQQDGVHLTEGSAKKFIEHMVTQSLNFFATHGANQTQTVGTDNDNAGSGTEVDMADSDAPTTNPFKVLKRKAIKTPVREGCGFVRRMEFDELKAKINERFDLDLLVAAKNHEEMDMESNRRNLNKVVLGGLTISGLDQQHQGEERVKTLKAAAMAILVKIDPDTPEPSFVWHLNRHMRSPKQILEVHLDSADRAIGIRTKYAGMNKEWRVSKLIPDKFKGVFINPSFTHSTRVRIEILKACAKVIKDQSTDGQDAWVIQHIVKPVLKIQSKQAEGGSKPITRTLGFTEALNWILAKYNLRQSDLADAYSLAGSRWGKAISHHFVVLKIDSDSPSTRSRDINKDGQKKRKLDQ